MSLANHPAFPHEVCVYDSKEEYHGLTKREYAAVTFLARLIGPHDTAVFGDQTEVGNKVGAAIHYANALFRELDKQFNPPNAG